MLAMRRVAAVVLVMCLGCLGSTEPEVPGLLLATTVHCLGGPCEETTRTAHLPVGFVAHVSAWSVYETGKINAPVTLSWTPESSVIVSGGGGLQGVAPGIATISATHIEYGTHASIDIEVFPIASMSIQAPAGATVAVGSKIEVAPIGHYGDASYFGMADLRSSTTGSTMWTSADEAIAAIEPPEYMSSPQLVRGVAPGQTTITAMFSGMSASIDTTVE